MFFKIIDISDLETYIISSDSIKALNCFCDKGDYDIKSIDSNHSIMITKIKKLVKILRDHTMDIE